MNSRLRTVGFIEAGSFLLLLGIAMPLKYIWGMSEAVRFVGSAHGLLFLLYVALAFTAAKRESWPVKRLITLLAASVLPLGPFVLDKTLFPVQSVKDSLPSADKHR